MLNKLFLASKWMMTAPILMIVILNFVPNLHLSEDVLIGAFYLAMDMSGIGILFYVLLYILASVLKVLK